MKKTACILLFLSLMILASCGWAADDDAVTAVYTYGRDRGKLASGFAVGDGSYVITSSETVKQTVWGKTSTVSSVVVVSRTTGDAYPASVLAVDDIRRVAIIKLPKPAFSPVRFAKDDEVSSILRATLGQVVSGEEIGDSYSSQLIALTVSRNPECIKISTWKSAAACQAEAARSNWLFLSKVTPPTQAPDGALVTTKAGEAIGIYQGRIVITGGQKPVTFYKVLPVTEIRKFLAKAGVSESSASLSPTVAKAGDAEAGFQAMCMMLSASLVGSQATAERAQTALKYRPKNAVAQMVLGIALSGQGKHDEAMKAINTALEIDPKLPDGQYNLGSALAVAGKTADAEKAFRQAIKDAPADHRPLLALADLLVVEGKRLEEALNLARQAVQIAPEDLSARVAVARVLKHQKEYDAALAELKSVLQSAPKWPVVHLALGATYEAQGDSELAEAQYRKLVEITPDNPGPRLVLIDLLIRTDKVDAARSELESARKLSLDISAREELQRLESKLTDPQS